MRNRTRIESLDQCVTSREIEQYFQAAIKDKPFENHLNLRQACNKRALQIAANFKRGTLLAMRLDKGKGNSRRYAVNGQRFHTGTWGNCAGFRWAMAGFDQWYSRLLREGGLRSKQKIDSIISWVRDDYLWRALRELEVCHLCEKGFPVKGGEHYGTQSLGMIPTQVCTRGTN